jgi:hypothetical protein
MLHPQLGQVGVTAYPHFVQKRKSFPTVVPQLGQGIINGLRSRK